MNNELKNLIEEMVNSLVAYGVNGTDEETKANKEYQFKRLDKFLEGFKTFGFYGKGEPRIEYRVMAQEKILTDKVSPFDSKNLKKFLYEFTYNK